MVHVDLECRLKAGEPARVEDYLNRYAELAQDDERVLELIRTEYSLRRRREQDVSLDEYIERFPQYQPMLAQSLSDEACGTEDLLGYNPVGSSPCRGQRLMTDDPDQPEPSGQSLAGRIDEICDCFEAARKRRNLHSPQDEFLWRPEKLRQE